jgi:cysteinyl-tRNA synthetase
MIHVYNSLSQQKEIFKPLNPPKVGIYVCGMTVYDLCHIGHARMLVAFDMITRYLRASGYVVNYVRNITDVDDKIIKRAQENNEAFDALVDRMVGAMNEDLQALGVLPPDQEPRATQHIPHMVAMIQTLIDKDFAYVADNGDVCYHIKQFKTYGELARQELEDMRAGARVEVDNSKRDPLDFVLWKLAKPGEPFWDSPWGQGRPGWHIECSAMSINCLGEHFDIHGGGLDLTFPHHQNEIAQSEAATGKKFANYWLHNGFVQVNKEKMSKSLGNFFTIRDVLKKYSGEMIRYFLLASHYRSPLNYSEENLQGAHAALERFYIALRGLEELASRSPSRDRQGAVEESANRLLARAAQMPNDYAFKFKEAMDDDFNTPVALSILFDLAREINRLKETDKQQAAQLGILLKQLGGVLGILQQDPEQFLQGNNSNDETQKIENLIAARKQARQEKNWQESDRIRDQLTQMGVSLEDTPQGTTWRKL